MKQVLIIFSVILILAGCHETITTTVKTPLGEITTTGTVTADIRYDAADVVISENSSLKLASIAGQAFFDFNSATLTKEAMEELSFAAEFLRGTNEKIIISGNCDERGTIEYNQVLGQRRANVSSQYLHDLGISFDRMIVVSYGKEIPECQEHNESCWKRNRRVDIKIQE